MHLPLRKTWWWCCRLLCRSPRWRAPRTAPCARGFSLRCGHAVMKSVMFLHAGRRAVWCQGRAARMLLVFSRLFFRLFRSHHEIYYVVTRRSARCLAPRMLCARRCSCRCSTRSCLQRAPSSAPAAGCCCSGRQVSRLGMWLRWRASCCSAYDAAVWRCKAPARRCWRASPLLRRVASFASYLSRSPSTVMTKVLEATTPRYFR